MGYQGRSLSINQYDNTDVIILDDISSGFDGSTSSFTLTQNGANFQNISAVSTLVKLGGIIQTPNEDYTISYSSGVSTINFTTTPLVGLTCEIRTLLGTTVGNVGPDQVRRTNLNLSQTSDPTVDLGAGDLYYNSTNEILKTYNLTNTSWDTVYDRDVLFLDSTNNRVGIGVTSPDTEIHVKRTTGFPEVRIDVSTAPDTSYGTFRIMGDGGGSGKYLIGYNSAQVDYANMLSLKNQDGDIAFYTGGVNADSERLRITSTGSVGIGTDNPDRLLHLSSNTNTRAKIATTSASSFGQLYLGDEEKWIVGYRESHPNEPHAIALKATNSSGYINLFTGGSGSTSERLRIASNGRIGINSAGDPTDIPGTSHDTVVVGNSAATVGGITLEIAAGNNCSFQMYAQGSQPAGRFLYDGSDNTVKIWSQNSGGTSEDARMTFKENGNVEINDGNLVLASGHGIDFSATSDATGMTSELLDDYEEGNWTPVYSSSAGCFNGVTAFSNEEGRYIKIGRQVTAWFIFQLTGSVTNAEGILRGTGLPYNANFSSVNYGCGSAQLYNAHGSGDSEVLSAGTHNTNDTFYLYRGTVSGTTGGTIMGFVTYRTA